MLNIFFHLLIWTLKDGAGLNMVGQHKILVPVDKNFSVQKPFSWFQSDLHFLNTTHKILHKEICMSKESPNWPRNLLFSTWNARTFYLALMIVQSHCNITAVTMVSKPADTSAISGKQPQETDLTFDQQIWSVIGNLCPKVHSEWLMYTK